jgi:hypothetical protein
VTAKLTELIDGPDNVEVVRDKIATILLEEQAAQQVLAAAATPTPKDPRLWALRVFTEAANPWSQFADVPSQLDATPIVNVSIQRGDYDGRASDVIERQKTDVTYNIDCYGYGVSATDGGSGHTPGDSKASLEAVRAFRLVRRILMAAVYTYLDLRGTVWKRFPLSFEVFNPSEDQRPVQHVVGLRWQLQVAMNEFSPQVKGEIIEQISLTVHRGGTGEIYFNETIPIP